MVVVSTESTCLLGGGVFGDSLGSFRYGVLGQLTGEEQSHGSLDLPRGDGASLVVVSETAGFSGDALKDVVHERVHDGHGFGGDASVGVDLLEHLVDVDGVGFLPLPLLLLVAGAHGLSLAGLLGSFARYFGWHGCSFRSAFEIQNEGRTRKISYIRGGEVKCSACHSTSRAEKSETRCWLVGWTSRQANQSRASLFSVESGSASQVAIHRERTGC